MLLLTKEVQREDLIPAPNDIEGTARHEGLRLYLMSNPLVPLRPRQAIDLGGDIDKPF